MKSSGKSRAKGLFLVPGPAPVAAKADDPTTDLQAVDLRAADLQAADLRETEQKQLIAALVAELTVEYQPNGPTEKAMIHTMAAARWRANYSVQLHSRAEQSLEWEKLLSLERYQAANEKSFRMALKTLRTLQKARPRPKLVKPKTTGGC